MAISRNPDAPEVNVRTVGKPPVPSPCGCAVRSQVYRGRVLYSEGGFARKARTICYRYCPKCFATWKIV